MKRELKEKWVAALRSGEYRQGKKQLRRAGKFCCLGVLCDVIDPEGWTSKMNWRGENGSLPMKEAKELGLLNFTTQPKVTTSELIEMNDEQGMTFKEIAEYIETNL